MEGTAEQQTPESLATQVGRFMAVGEGVLFVSGGEDEPGIIRQGALDLVGGTGGDALTDAGKKMIQERRERLCLNEASPTGVEAGAGSGQQASDSKSPASLLDEYIQRQVSAAFSGAASDGVTIVGLLASAPGAPLVSEESAEKLRVAGLAVLGGWLYVRIGTGTQATTAELPKRDRELLSRGPLILKVSIGNDATVTHVLQVDAACDPDCGGLCTDGEVLIVPVASSDHAQLVLVSPKTA